MQRVERFRFRTVERLRQRQLPVPLDASVGERRQGRQQPEALVACFLPLGQVWAAQRCPYEALDSSGIPCRDAKRRSAGWLPGWAGMRGCLPTGNPGWNYSSALRS